MAETASFDVIVVGAGPAGISAASAAAVSGATVGLLDENAQPGGQIYRGSGSEPNPQVRKYIQELDKRKVQRFSGTTVFDALAPGTLCAITGSTVRDFQYNKLVLAVGGRELFLPFPGWTLPNVIGVGGLQAVVKGGLDVTGKRIVVAGSGPLLLAVGAYLKQHGAKVVVIAEQTTMAKLAKFSLNLGLFPSKLNQGLSLMASVGPLVRPSAWVERAEGIDKLQSIKLNKSASMIPCDYLACSFGFVPNLELPMLMGCEISDGVVKVDEFQNTSQPNVLCAGEPTGIGGVDLSIFEGAIAGSVATGQIDRARTLLGERRNLQKFAAALDRTFAVREEVRALAKPDTVMCRCEDVSVSQLRGFESAVAAKLHTRCGMGSCQGRICGPATRLLFGWEHGTVRPPLVPVPLSVFETPDTLPSAEDEG